MELYDETKEARKSKLPMIIAICIAILVVITILIIAGILYLNQLVTVIKIDGVRNNNIEQILYLEETAEGKQLYIPINKIAEFLGYKGYVGDFKNKSEDKTKCYVENENEVAMFSLGSNVLVKASNNSEYEYVDIDKPVFEKDGELYTTIDGIQKAFNIIFSADEKFKNIEIYSMNYLVTYYGTALKIEKYSTDFVDQKAIFENMMIIQNGEKYGVIDVVTGKSVLETKYEQIKYLPVTKDFLVKSNNKYGVISKDASIKVKIVYDEIKIMDNKNGLYLVKQNNTYGVVKTDGDVIIAPEYSQIGIESNTYIQNGIDNQYVLLDKIIPIKNNQSLWAFFDIQGKKITEFKYTGIGCKSSSVSNSYPVIVIPSSKVLVVQSKEYYNLVSIEGEELVPGNILNTVYLKSNTETDQNQFFMTYNNNEKVINIEEWLAGIGR